MTDTPQDDPRTGRHRFVVNRGADQDLFFQIDADDYEHSPAGVHFTRGMDEVAFASYPVTVRRAEDVPAGQE